MELGLLWVFAVVFGIVLLIAWIVLPFAVIGTKPLLEKLLAEQQRTNALLASLTSDPASTASSAPRPGFWEDLRKNAANEWRTLRGKDPI
jgi:hypothetical protein